jgi:energy-coupling factor transporter ATP-binding protein EcfA2
MGTGKRSLVNLMTRKEVALPGANMGHRMLQCSDNASLDSNIFKAFLRLEDPYLRIRGYPIPPKMVASMIEHINIVSLQQLGAGKSSLVNLTSEEKVARTAPDIRCRMLQCSETVNLDDKTSETFLRPEDPNLRIREHPAPPKMGTRRSKYQNIVLFGDTGAGKSSLINLIAGKKVARTSPDMQRCTMHWQEYDIGFGDASYKVFDTVGLEAPQLGIKEYLDFVENAYQLIKQLDKRGGIDLLLFCVRAGRVTATLQSNYRLFHEFLCEKRIPIVLAITNLEREKRMEDWWERNQGTFEKCQIQVAGHACITAANRLDGRHKDLYEESRITIRKLIKEFTTDGQKQAWTGGHNLFVSLMRKLKELLVGSPRVRMKDLVPHLTKRCGISREVAKKLADMIRHDVEAT